MFPCRPICRLSIDLPPRCRRVYKTVEFHFVGAIFSPSLTKVSNTLSTCSMLFYLLPSHAILSCFIWNGWVTVIPAVMYWKMRGG